MGGLHRACKVDDIVVDFEHRIVTTPAYMLAERISEAASGIFKLVDRIDEFTVEANPATVDAEKAELLVSQGVTRVSMGAQSFFPEELATLERIHSPDDIAPSVATLRRAGVLQINLDLIFGIPGQTLGTWSQSLSRAIELEPDHIACYGLMYEPGTVLTAMRRAGKIKPCDENLEADMFERMVSTLTTAGYEQYETSNFAKPGCRSEHNLIYWRNQPYIGVGPSAVGCLDGRRYKNVADVAGYIRTMDEHGHAEAESETIDTEKLITEMVMMQLRLVEGLSIESFRHRTGMDPVGLFGTTLDDLKRRGVLTVSDTHIALTQDGRLVSDAVMRELVLASEPAKDPRLAPTILR
ncbi:MAG: radical SAM family heme chaperone HemW [Planctomycetes bacterium]|nr:radical SAM family heme chaperone HemW [Planctomycetota bacterium]